MTRTLARGKRWKSPWLAGAAALVLLAGLAWLDGGREPLHEIVVSVDVPEAGR